MDDENTGVLDALIDDGGDTSGSEDISTTDEVAKYRELAENQRIRAEKAEAKLKGKKTETHFDPEVIRNEARATIREELDSQYLADSEYPDDVKDEIKKVAKMNGTTIKQAEKDPYIQYKIQQAVQEQRFNASAVRNTRNSTPTDNADEFLDPKNFDLNTEEGRKAWKEKKAKRGR